MKKFRYILPLLFLMGCSSSVTELYVPEEEGQAIVSLTVEKPETRSLNGTASETWEKKINTANIYVFNATTGKITYVYKVSSSQINNINSGSDYEVAFRVPVIGSQNYNIYFIANTTPSASIATETSFLASIEQDIALYNGSYSDATTKALRTNGFVMTGSRTNATLTNGSSSNVNITLRRIVAKVAFEINISALLTLGTSVVTNVTLSQSAPVSNLLPLAAGNTTGTAVSFNQTAQVNGTNSRQFFAFFYIYENDARSVTANQVKGTFQVVNTVLGIGTTYTYNFAITGDSSTGKITRNRGYYITANVNKLINILFTRSSEIPSDVLSIEERIE